MQAEGIIGELTLVDGAAAVRIRCPDGIVPAIGQYVLAHVVGSIEPLATTLFAAGASRDGFLTAPPIPSTWRPGMQLHLRGPLGHGFSLPSSARRIALVAFKCTASILLSLLEPAFEQGASVALLAAKTPEDLPLQVEVHPPKALPDICRWADFIALDATRDTLPELKQTLLQARFDIKAKAQILVRTPMPCGALAACGVCAVDVGGKVLLACEDGPVFGLDQVMGWSSRA
jgi:dihydroorotate dehydrogenase electron transfer subunit